MHCDYEARVVGRNHDVDRDPADLAAVDQVALLVERARLPETTALTSARLMRSSRMRFFAFRLNFTGAGKACTGLRLARAGLSPCCATRSSPAHRQARSAHPRKARRASPVLAGSAGPRFRETQPAVPAFWVSAGASAYVASRTSERVLEGQEEEVAAGPAERLRLRRRDSAQRGRRSGASSRLRHVACAATVRAE